MKSMIQKTFPIYCRNTLCTSCMRSMAFVQMKICRRLAVPFSSSRRNVRRKQKARFLRTRDHRHIWLHPCKSIKLLPMNRIFGKASRRRLAVFHIQNVYKMELVALRARGAFVLVAREPGLVLSLGSTLELVEPDVSSA